MSFPGLENQKFSEKTLKGFLLKNLEQNPKSDGDKALNYHLIKRVDEFWDKVVTPLQSSDNFDGNKINWYYEIYKEGLEAKKLAVQPIVLYNISENTISEIITLFKDRTLGEYLELGTSFLSNVYAILSSRIRDQMVQVRLKHIYYSENPRDWVTRAEDEENGVMNQQPENIKDLVDIVNNISLIISRRY